VDVDVDVDVDTNVDNNVRIAVDSPTTLRALADAAWPGRCQRLLWSRPTGCGGSGTGTGASDTTSKGNRAIEFFLDGAHTPQSLEATVEWFRSKTSTNTSTSTSTGTTGGNTDRRPLPILVFNCSHERNPVELLELLLLLRARDDSDAMGQRASSAPSSAPARCCCYSRVYFARADSSRPSPLAKASAEELLEERGIRIRPELLLLLGDANGDANGDTNGDANAAATVRTWQETLAGVWRHLTEDDECASAAESESAAAAASHSESSSSNAIVCNRTAREVLDDLLSATPESGGDDSSPTTQVFVTGSLYLVGSFLAAMDWKEESSPAPS